MRILFDKNVPVGVRRFLPEHEVRTTVDLKWPPQLKNGELLRAAVDAGFDVLITADQNIKHQQNLEKIPLAILVLGSNIWPVVQLHSAAIAAKVSSAARGSYQFVEMQLPPRPRNV